MSGYGMCAECGHPLTDAEMFRGDCCESCDRLHGEWLDPYGDADDAPLDDEAHEGEAA